MGKIPTEKGVLLFWLIPGDASAFKSITFMVRSTYVLETRGTPQICLIQVAKNTRGGVTTAVTAGLAG